MARSLAINKSQTLTDRELLPSNPPGVTEVRRYLSRSLKQRKLRLSRRFFFLPFGQRPVGFFRISGFRVPLGFPLDFFFLFLEDEQDRRWRSVNGWSWCGCDYVCVSVKSGLARAFVVNSVYFKMPQLERLDWQIFVVLMNARVNVFTCRLSHLYFTLLSLCVCGMWQVASGMKNGMNSGDDSYQFCKTTRDIERRKVAERKDCFFSSCFIRPVCGWK